MFAFLVAFLVSLIVTLLLIRYQHFHGHITGDNDLNGIQKFHAKPVPRIGGLGIFIALIICEVANLFLEAEVAKFGLLVVVASVPAFFAGFIEDLTKRVSVNIRFLATIFSALIGGTVLSAWITRLNIPAIDYLLVFGIASIMLTCFAVAGVVNAFNIIDGYNGLSGMVAVIILGGISYVANQVGDRAISITALAAAGSISGFLVWNYPRGLIFLGDGGAYLIGFIVAELSILLVGRKSRSLTLVPFFALFLPNI